MTKEEVFEEKHRHSLQSIKEEIQVILDAAEKEEMGDLGLELIGEAFGFNNCLYQCVKHEQLLVQLRNMKNNEMQWNEKAMLNSVITMVEGLK